MLLSKGKSAGSRRVAWAIADQAAVSGGNFLTSLILLRTLLPTEFGTYALILNSIIFANNLQQAFIGYPLCVRAARSNAAQLRRVLSFALLGTVLLQLTLFAPALTAVNYGLHQSSLLLASVIALCCWQLQDTVRASFQAKLEQRRALLGDAMSYIGQAVLLGLLCLRHKPQLATIFWIIAATSLAALLVQLAQSRPSLTPKRVVRPLAREFWRLGYWTVGSKLVSFLTLQAFPWVMLIRHGPVEVAGFQAVFQFMAFSNPLMFSIGSLITATTSKDRTYKTPAIRKYILFSSGLMICYLMTLGLAAPFLLRVLYGVHSPYLVYGTVLRVFAAAWKLEVAALLATAILGGLREPRSVFLQQFSGATIALLFGLPLAFYKGLLAAIIGILLVSATRAAAGVFLILKSKGRAHRSEGKRSGSLRVRVTQSIVAATSVES